MRQPAVVEIDERPERVHEHARRAGSLMVHLVRYSVQGGVIMGLLWSQFAKAVTPWEMFTFAFYLFGGTTFAFALVIFATDQWIKIKKCRGYGLSPRLGTHERQARHVTVVAPPVNLAALVTQALQSLHANIEIHAPDPNTIVAKRGRDPEPGALVGLPSVIRVEMAPPSEDKVALRVESVCGETDWFTRLLRPPVFDVGRSIENVEKFQLALKRLVETDHMTPAQGGNHEALEKVPSSSSSRSATARQ